MSLICYHLPLAVTGTVRTPAPPTVGRLYIDWRPPSDRQVRRRIGGTPGPAGRLARPPGTSCPSPARRVTRASSTSSPAFWDLKFPHHHGWVARRENPRREAALDHRPGGHDGVVTDAAARQHEHAITEPDVLTDNHGTGLVWVTGVKLVIIRIVYRREVTDQGVIADLYRLFRRDDDHVIDEDPVTNQKLRIGAGAKLASRDATADDEPPADSYRASAAQRRQAPVAGDKRGLEAMEPEQGGTDGRLEVEGRSLPHFFTVLFAVLF